MAVCLTLNDYRIEVNGHIGQIELVTANSMALAHFTNILCSSLRGFQPAGQSYATGYFNMLVARRLISRSGVPSQSYPFLALLKQVLTIDDDLDESHAFDFHQDDVESTGQLERTVMGTLVYQAKYGREPNALPTLLDYLEGFVRHHPRYLNASVVTAVPPHDGALLSLPQLLAQNLADRLNMKHGTIGRTMRRDSQKVIIVEERLEGVRQRFANQHGTMTARQDMTGHRAIVLDDLYGSGASISEAARALRAAGATEVLGLVATKQHLYEAISAKGWGNR